MGYNNETLMYSVYVPADYDASKKYPLVLFMSDSSEIGSDPLKALTDCYGATIWAAPSEQAKHECIVVVPQYNTAQPIVNDQSQASEYLDITIDLVKSLESQYSVGTDRIYNTGQSMGGMMPGRRSLRSTMKESAPRSSTGTGFETRPFRDCIARRSHGRRANHHEDRERLRADGANEAHHAQA